MKSLHLALPLRALGLALVPACIVLAALLGGCADGRLAVDGSQPVEIRYWTGWSGYELRALKDVIKEFERAHPHIRVRVTSVASSYDKVRLAFASGSTPDVMSCVWGDEIPVYAMRGLLEPLDEWLAGSSRSLDEWIPVCAEMGRYRGKTYGLAATTNCKLIAFNKKIVREAGLDPDSPPQNAEELRRWNEAMTIYEDGTYKRVGFIPQSLELWAYAFGGQWYDRETGRITADHPGNLAALRWLASWARSANALAMQRFEQTASGNIVSANGPFLLGKLAMVGTGDWFGALMRQYGDDIEWGYTGFNGLAEGGRRNVSDINGSVFVIPSASTRKKEAWEFLNWICGPDGSYLFCKAISNLPALRELQDRPPFSTDPFLRFCVEVSRSEGAFPPPPIPIFTQYRQEIIRVEDHVVRGGADPEKLLKDLQVRMEAELKRMMETVAPEPDADPTGEENR